MLVILWQSSMTNNNSGEGYNKAEDFAAYDKLPPRLRQLFQDMPDNVSVQWAKLLQKRYGLDNAELYDELTERMKATRAEMVRHHYGHAHPMAQQSCPWPFNPQSTKQRLTRITRVSM